MRVDRYLRANALEALRRADTLQARAVCGEGAELPVDALGSVLLGFGLMPMRSIRSRCARGQI